MGQCQLPFCFGGRIQGLPHADPDCCEEMGNVSTIKLRQHAWTRRRLEILDRTETTTPTLTDIDRKIHGVDAENREGDSRIVGLTSSKRLRRGI